MGTKRGTMNISFPKATHYRVSGANGRFRALRYTESGKQVGAVKNNATNSIWFDSAYAAAQAARDEKLSLFEGNPITCTQSSLPPNTQGGSGTNVR